MNDMDDTFAHARANARPDCPRCGGTGTRFCSAHENDIDLWAYARANARPGCPRCGGTGTYMYDHNHGTICNLCCRHDRGWWQLLEHYGARNGMWCCRAGCGHVVADKPGDGRP